MERRPIPGYPGCEIDSNHHVFKVDGSEAAYSISKKFSTCARLKHESGEWRYPAIYVLQEMVGFRETYAEKKARKAKGKATAPTWVKHYNSLAEAHGEDAEAFPDPSCRKSCCAEVNLD